MTKKTDLEETDLEETDLELSDGRTLHVYDTGADRASLTVFWHHGTPNTGAPPEPLFPAAAECGIRWVSHDRPGYGGSTPARAGCGLGRRRCGQHRRCARHRAIRGHGAFGRGPARPGVCRASPGPRTGRRRGLRFDAEDLDWFAGMTTSATAEMRAAAAGRAAYQEYLASAEFDPEMFTPADQAALSGEWSWLARIAGQAIAGGPAGMIDDELAYVNPWGFAPGQVECPVLVLHGGQDRMVPSAHGAWLARHCRAADLWLRPDDGHVSVLGSSAVAALDWLAEPARQRY